MEQDTSIVHINTDPAQLPVSACLPVCHRRYNKAEIAGKPSTEAGRIFAKSGLSSYFRNFCFIDHDLVDRLAQRCRRVNAIYRGGLEEREDLTSCGMSLGSRLFETRFISAPIDKPATGLRTHDDSRIGHVLISNMSFRF
jgi:hypothetical protein